MATYLYTARDESGQQVSGTLSAGSVAEATRQLRGERKYATSLRESSSGGPGPGAAGTPGARGYGESEPRAAGPGGGSGGIRVRRADLIQLSTQLSVMLETGVTLSDALDCIGQHARNPTFRSLVDDLAATVRGGNDFSTAIARHPRTFPRLYVALMRAAEKSGQMSRMLIRATGYLRDEQETRRRVRGALTYPAIMLAFAILTTGFLLAFVLPRFAAIYANKGAALPIPTRVLMNASHLLVTNWVFILLGVAAAGTAAYLFLRSPRGAATWHAAQLRLPLLGNLFRKLHLACGLRMMGTLSGAGVHLLDCVENTIEATSNTLYRRMWSEVSNRLRQGRPMSDHLTQSPLVPPDVAQMLMSGENSGKLAQVMEQVANYTEAELKERIVELTRYIEPAMIITMGIIIGGVALALMLPVFTMGRVIAN